MWLLCAFSLPSSGHSLEPVRLGIIVEACLLVSRVCPSRLPPVSFYRRNHRSLPPGMNHERDHRSAARGCRSRLPPRRPVRGGVPSPNAVGLAPSLLPRPGAVAITVTTTALDRVRVVWCVATRASRGSGVVWRASLWVGLVLRLVCEVLVSVSCASRLPPVSLNRYEAC